MSNWGDDILEPKARKLGYELEATKRTPGDKNLGHGGYFWILRDGVPIFKFPWSGEEIWTWLCFREKDRKAAEAEAS